MSMFQESTATELADYLEAAHRHPHMTGVLSMLDEATISFGRKSAEIAEAQRAFANARYAHMRSYSNGKYSDTAWSEAMEAARNLAATLRPLGDTIIDRCKEPTGWGTCNLPLDDQDQCRMRNEHTN